MREPRRGRRRRARGPDRSDVAKVPKPLCVRNPYPPMEILSADQVERIHQASLEVLRDSGMNFLSSRAVEILRAAGADVDDDNIRVRFDPAFITERIATAPPEFSLHARDPIHTVRVGGRHIVFTTVSSPPHASDLDGGRRPGNFVDYCNFVRLLQSIPVAQMLGGYPVEPTDIEARTRHLLCGAAAAKLTTKPLYGYAIGSERIEDSLEIVRIARGVTTQTLMTEPSMTTVVNANSPLIYDGPMLEGAIAMALMNQPVIYTPFTLAGAMAPITLAGALVQQNAEALAGVAFSQCVNPGAPAIYGSFTSNVDMKSGAPAFGTPEYVKATIASGQLARRYNLPFRASNANASNAPDAQAAYESQMSLWACLLGGVNIVKHGLGWLEGGLCASFEKFIMDAEMIAMLISFLEPLEVDHETLAREAIEEVGPGSHFFQAAHTMARYRDAFYAPMLSDWQNFENWRDGGSVDATMRANRIFKQLLADYEEPAMDPAISEEIDEFVARRVEEGGAPAL